MTTSRLPTLALRAKFRRWFESRLPFRDSMTLNQRTVYILPTKPGWMLALTVLVLLATSINYQLNLGYLLTFLLSGCAAVGMHVCHGTLRGLSLHLTPPPAQFANSPTTVEVVLSHQRRSARHGIGVSVLGSEHWVWTDVPAQGRSVVHISWLARRRGLQRVPTLTAETRFPLGTFRVWTVWRPAAEVLIYPAPESKPPPLPALQARSEGGGTRRDNAKGDYDGIRAYQRGDPLKQILWKQLAKSDQLVSRDQERFQHEELWLDLTRTGLAGGSPAQLEHQLERLCAWVLLAEKRGTDYGLRLPGIEIAPACGEAHKRRCLEALALC